MKSFSGIILLVILTVLPVMAEGPAASTGGAAPSAAGSAAAPIALPGQGASSGMTGTIAMPTLQGQPPTSGQTSGQSGTTLTNPNIQLPADASVQKTDSGKVQEKSTIIISETKAQPVESSPVEKAMIEDSQTVDKSQPQGFAATQISQFGYNFFKADAAGFAPMSDIPVGPDYMIGVGDRIIITAWGSLEGTYELEVNRNGEIVLPKVGSVRVLGIEYGQLQPVIKANLAKVFKDFQLNVNMGKLRLMKVYLVGNVKSPGDYNIPSLATLINALAVAGGPTKNGSLRAIEIKRNGKIIDTIDLYGFFLSGDKSRDVRLQPGDTIFVPTIGPVAGIAGNVRRPAIYELKGEKNLADLLALADGINPGGYLQRIQVSRLVAHEKKIVSDFNLDPIKTGKNQAQLFADISIQDLDVVRIFPIDATLRGYIRLDGYVLRPGNYALTPGMTIKDILSQDNILPEYNQEIGEITRLVLPDNHPEKILFNPGKALGGDPKFNLELKEFDTLKIFSKWDLEEIPKVRVSGEVQKPGEYRLFQNMTVRDLLVQAGNPKTTANLQFAELKRLDFSGVNIIPTSIYFNLKDALDGGKEQNLALKPFDEIIVKKWFAKEELPVSISGEVKNPGQFRYVAGMTVRDLVLEAGNVKKTAYLANAEVTRQKIEGDAIRSFPLIVNLGKALENEPTHNIQLEPFDVVVIRRIPYWTEETERYATIGGEVVFPGTYPVYKGEKLSNLIERAGGFTDKAYLRGVRFTRESVRQIQQKRMDEAIVKSQEDIVKLQTSVASTASSPEELAAAKAQLDGMQRTIALLKQKKAEGRLLLTFASLSELKGSSYDLELQGGDSLTIPRGQGEVNILGNVFNPTSVVYQQGESVNYYLDKVGGPTRDADTSQIYVVKADGSVLNRHNSASFLFFNSFGMKSLDSGDTIIVPQQLEKTAWLRDIKDITTILGQIALTAGVLIAAGL